MEEGEEQGVPNHSPRWLLLHGLPYAEHKTINCCGLSGHHVFVMVEFSFRGVNKFYSYLLGFLNGSLEFNRDHGWDGGFLNGSLRFNRRVS